MNDYVDHIAGRAVPFGRPFTVGEWMRCPDCAQPMIYRGPGLGCSSHASDKPMTTHQPRVPPMGGKT